VTKVITAPAVGLVGVLLSVPCLALVGQEPVDPPSLTLPDAIRRGLTHDPAVRASAASSDAASAAVGEASASWFPRVAVTAAATRYQKPMIVSPIHDFQPGQTPPFDETLLQAGATLSYTLFEGGARPARVRSVREQALAADAAYDEARQELIARVVSTYLSALSGQGILHAHDRRLAALTSEESRVRQRRDAGKAADVDVLRVEAALASARAERVGLAAALGVAERDLARLIGVDVEETRADRLVAVTWSDTTLPDRDGLYRHALEASPTVAQARRGVGADRANQRLARSARWPRLDLFGGWIDRGSAEGDFTAEWNVGLQFSYLVFSGGAVSRGVARADAARRASDERLRLIESRVAHDVDRARSTVEEARARVLSLRTAVARFAEVARIERLRLDAGAGTETDYLNAEAELLVARAGLVDAQHREMAARVELARIVGRLDVPWLERYVEIAR
jgi:outer membrane protein